MLTNYDSTCRAYKVASVTFLITSYRDVGRILKRGLHTDEIEAILDTR